MPWSSWDKPGAALRFAVPTGAGDLSGYAALSLRAAVDPVSALNTDVKPQAFTVRLTDGRGKQARASTRPDDAVDTFPPGSSNPFSRAKTSSSPALSP